MYIVAKVKVQTQSTKENHTYTVEEEIPVISRIKSKSPYPTKAAQGGSLRPIKCNT